MDQIMTLYESSLRDLLTELGTRGEKLLEVQDLTYLKVISFLNEIQSHRLLHALNDLI